MENGKKVHALPSRNEVHDELTWRLEDIFPSDDDWNKEYEAVKEKLAGAASYQGKLGESAEQLYHALQFQDEVTERFGKLYTYAHMRYDQDTTNAFYQGMDSKAKSLAAQVGSAFAFVVPEILSIEEAKLNQFLEAYVPLQLYRHVLEEINEMRPHILSKEEEALLAQVSEVLNTSSTTFGMLNNADLEFPTVIDENGNEVQITHGRFTRLLESKDRRVRKEAFQKLYATYKKFTNTFASTLSGQVKKNNVVAQIRHYHSAREAALAANHIPEKVYDQLVETVNRNLGLLQRYVALRKKVLQLDEVHMYDLYTPLVQDVDMEVTYEKAKEIVLDGLHPLGGEYQGILQQAFENRWIDVVENKGKRSGAYSSGAYGTNPYILLNWQDNIDNVFTLAHELGHSVHSYYTRKNQPYPYGDYSIFVAEVAS
ncbi:M3 family oligoendopeptidase, partial [Heyndrickxia coagulans]